MIYTLGNNETSHFRFSISIGKKYGIAVKRNLMKRRIREIIKKHLDLLKNLDYVFVVKPTSNILDFNQIEQNIVYLLNNDRKKEENK